MTATFHARTLCADLAAMFSCLSANAAQVFHVETSVPSGGVDLVGGGWAGGALSLDGG